jgi:hypothetical protein
LVSVVVSGLLAANATGIEDGGAIETAIVLPRADRVGAEVRIEHEWIRKNLPGWETVSSGITEDQGKVYDVILLPCKTKGT